MKRAVDLCPSLTGGKGIEHLSIIRHGVRLLLALIFPRGVIFEAVRHASEVKHIIEPNLTPRACLVALYNELTRQG